MNSAEKPLGSQRDKVLDHTYDGIAEYDNPLPSWWVGVFVVSIFFAAGYWVYYHMGGGGLSNIAVYANNLEKWNKTREAALAKSIKVTPELLAGLAAKADEMEKAKKIYVSKCQVCHLADGGGLVGPNFTDHYQLYGNDRLSLFQTIRDGKPAKGMQSWAPVLSPLDMARLASFVANLRGTTPAKGKAPQGKKIIAPYRAAKQGGESG